MGSIGKRLLHRGKSGTHNNKKRQIFHKIKGLLAGLSLMVLLAPNFVSANPEGGQVAAGSANVDNSNPNVVHVNQSSDKAIINWQSYNIGSNESVNYHQPNASSITLNRINPQQGASKIFGSITANGRVWLVNPAGIWFAPGSYVNVSGILATTADIKDQDFMSGNYHFVQSPEWNGAIVNQGLIVVRNAGLAAFIGVGVINDGKIEANMGTVVLGASREFTVDFSGDHLINFAVGSEVTQYAVDAQGHKLSSAVSNTGSIIANGGKVELTAKAAGAVLDNVINMSGIVQAKSVGVVNGEIILGANAGTVHVSGKLIASGKQAGETGGRVKVLGGKVILDGNAEIDVSGYNGGGEILIGGNAHGAGPEMNASRTVVGSHVMLIASALVSGNGGKVVVWSNLNTQFSGTILAQGGSQGGNGGWVETSGKAFLDVTGGRVNTIAPYGAFNGNMVIRSNEYLHRIQSSECDSSGHDGGCRGNYNDSFWRYFPGVRPRARLITNNRKLNGSISIF